VRRRDQKSKASRLTQRLPRNAAVVASPPTVLVRVLVQAVKAAARGSPHRTHPAPERIWRQWCDWRGDGHSLHRTRSQLGRRGVSPAPGRQSHRTVAADQRGQDIQHLQNRSAELGSDYLNAVAEIQTSLNAPALLQCLQQLEQAAGRERPYPDAPRTLDLDLLLYGSASIQSADLTVPHPRMWQRAFVLVPLAEIAPGLVGHSHLQAVQGQKIAVFDANLGL
jgi:2-amino-4-hydroxy-6-hydroxymethyldihydropteridine diphosphokinase